MHSQSRAKTNAETTYQILLGDLYTFFGKGKVFAISLAQYDKTGHANEGGYSRILVHVPGQHLCFVVLAAIIQITELRVYGTTDLLPDVDRPAHPPGHVS